MRTRPLHVFPPLAAALIGAALLVAAGFAVCAAGQAGTPDQPGSAAEIATQAAAAAAAEPFALRVPLGLSTDFPHAEDNPLTRERVELGRRLYYDKRLSVAGDVSCATCHDPAKGFSDGRPTSTGHKGQKGTRNAPTVINSAYHYFQFWDGRAGSLEEQALGPIQNPIEMGNSLEGMIGNLQGIAAYAPRFERAFGSPGITPERVSQAIAAFERTILSGNSRWDRYMEGDPGAMTASQIRGWQLFQEKARCTLCHAGQSFSDSDFHNLGVGMAAKEPDLGRWVVTKAEADRGAFKTPPLRDVTKTGPYMHDGSQKTLAEVVEFYNRGGEQNPWLSDKIKPLNLDEQEKKDLVAFLEALDGQILNPVGPISD